jgi:hypothetical protein
MRDAVLRPDLDILATRTTMIRALQDPETLSLYPREKAYVSGAAGAVAGGFVALALGTDTLLRTKISIHD